MKRIPLTRGKFALVDDRDYEELSRFKWHTMFSPTNGNFYAARDGRNLARDKGRYVVMHRQILGICDRNISVDHKNHNGLDNRKSNLRVCTASQNMMNRRGAQKNSTTGWRGVYIDKRNPIRKFYSEIRAGKKKIFLGYFKTVSEARRAYASANRKYYGEFGGGF